MGITVAVVAQGSMGSGVGRRLNERGAEVRTLLSGRSAASAERARAAGMQPAADEKALLDGADFFLSILPPDEAENLARQLAPALTALAKKPVYVDCNAISPQTAERVAAIVAPTGAKFVDGGIIGGPPREGYSPAIYASGPAVGETAMLRDWGIDWRAIDGPIGAASGLKMSYAGITKGITAIASAMLLGAARFGCAEALIAELSSSQPRDAEADAAAASPACTTRPIAGSARWRRSPISSAPTRRRATSTPRSPGSTNSSPPPRRRQRPAPTTRSRRSTGCWGAPRPHRSAAPFGASSSAPTTFNHPNPSPFARAGGSRAGTTNHASRFSWIGDFGVAYRRGNARAVRYRERATQLREMAEDIHLVGHVRDSLFRLADQLDQLAVTVERSLTS